MSCIIELLKYHYKNKEKLEDIIGSFKKEITAYNFKNREIPLSLKQYLLLEIKGYSYLKLLEIKSYSYLNSKNMYLLKYYKEKSFLVDKTNKEEK
ncbi:MAG: hypothetical protein QW038_01700 [Nanopusillaceae archaeon]